MRINNYEEELNLGLFIPFIINLEDQAVKMTSIEKELDNSTV